MSIKRSVSKISAVAAALVFSFAVIDSEQLAKSELSERTMASVDQVSFLPGQLVAPVSVAFFWTSY